MAKNKKTELKDHKNMERIEDWFKNYNAKAKLNYEQIALGIRRYYIPEENMEYFEIAEEITLQRKPILETATNEELTLKSGEKVKGIHYYTTEYETIDEYYTYMEAYEKYFKPKEKGVKINTIEDLKNFISIAENLKQKKLKDKK